MPRENEIALFIIDIQLEDYKGTDLAKQLRGLPEYRYTPIIFETELAGEELSAYRDVKCYSFLVKPFGEKEFAEAFRERWDFPGRSGGRGGESSLSKSSLFWSMRRRILCILRPLGRNWLFIRITVCPEEKRILFPGIR